MKLRYLLLVAAALASCQTPDSTGTTPEAPAPAATITSDLAHTHITGVGSGHLSAAQLARVRLATASYHDLARAKADGYQDINVVLPNMGRHFLRDSLLDGRFDPERPELLVYAPVNGREVLVAVEYAVPLDLSATAPEGFEGDGDVWFADQTFKLWTLHAWVWRNNPDGIFNPTNKEVP